MLIFFCNFAADFGAKRVKGLKWSNKFDVKTLKWSLRDVKGLNC